MKSRLTGGHPVSFNVISLKQMHGFFYLCNLCDTKFSFVRSDWYYDLDGEHMPIAVRPAWCIDCNKLRSAEALPTIEDCQQKIDELSSKRTARGSRLAYPKKLEVAILRLEWRRKRISAPRCIWCGGTNLQFLNTEPRNGLIIPFTHPECGGMISYSSGFLGSASPSLFSGEGICREQEP